MFHVPAAFHELDGEPIEQLLVYRRFALRAQIIQHLRQACAEQQLPHAVHEDSCRQRILSIHQPVGEVEARQALTVHRDRFEEVWGLRLDDFAGIIHPVAPRQNADFS